MKGTKILPGTGRWQPKGLTEGPPSTTPLRVAVHEQVARFPGPGCGSRGEPHLLIPVPGRM